MKKWQEESLEEAKEVLTDFIDRGNKFHWRGKDRTDVLGVAILAIDQVRELESTIQFLEDELVSH